MRAGQIVLAIGTHLGIRNLVTIGVVSGTGISNIELLSYENFIVTDAKVNRGSGGSPLVNLRGEVVGMNSNALTPAEEQTGLCFSIPSNFAKRIVKELLDHGKVVRAWLGVNIQDLTTDMAKDKGLTDSKCALAAQVVPGSPAEKAGIKSGDIIVAFNHRPVSSGANLKWQVGIEKPGTSAKLSVVRDKERMEITVLLEERTEQPYSLPK